MLKYMTLLNWVELIIIIALKISILKLSWNKIKTLSITLTYSIIKSVVLIWFILFGNPQSYSKTFYFLSIFECLLFSLVAIELSSNCIDRWKSFIKRWGALVIAVPTFCIATIFFPFSLNHLLEGTIRISQIAFILSLSLLFTCFAFEDKEPKMKLVGRSYAMLLSLLVICIQLQLKFGLATFVRQSWIISWIIGLSLILWSLIRCRYDGSSNINRRTTYGYSSEHGA